MNLDTRDGHRPRKPSSVYHSRSKWPWTEPPSQTLPERNSFSPLPGGVKCCPCIILKWKNCITPDALTSLLGSIGYTLVHLCFFWVVSGIAPMRLHLPGNDTSVFRGWTLKLNEAEAQQIIRGRYCFQTSAHEPYTRQTLAFDLGF